MAEHSFDRIWNTWRAITNSKATVRQLLSTFLPLHILSLFLYFLLWRAVINSKNCYSRAFKPFICFNFAFNYRILHFFPPQLHIFRLFLGNLYLEQLTVLCSQLTCMLISILGVVEVGNIQSQKQISARNYKLAKK